MNYFGNRLTNAAAESLNAKIKDFRAQLRGVLTRNSSSSDRSGFSANPRGYACDPKLLGHTSVRTTKIYADVVMAEVIDAILE